MAKKAKNKKATKANVIDTERYVYSRSKVRTSDGKIHHSWNNNDAIARALSGTNYEQQVKIMRANGLADRLANVHAKAESGKINRGLFRMYLGISLRAMVGKFEKKEGDPPTINGRAIKSLEQQRVTAVAA